jgi:diaminopimelate epimerase
MITLPFTKMTGAGNDFVLLDNIELGVGAQWHKLAPGLCDRRYGIGADGLLVIEPSDKASFRMMYYNADGSYGGMCGNGGRCAAGYVMAKHGTAEVHFEALDFIYSARKTGSLVSLRMKDPVGFRPSADVPYGGELLKPAFIDTGAPHAVIFIDTLNANLRSEVETGDLRRIGAAVRFAPAFSPAGTNADFLTMNPDGSVSMRTYERGVEAETLACGTGAVASALCANLLHGSPPPVTVITRSNEKLVVDFRKDGLSVHDVTLTGPADEVYSGTIRITG